MQGQLNEMRAEQRPNLWVASDLGAPTFVAAGGQIIWTIHLTNYGKNFVVRGTIHKFMLLGDSGFTPSYGEPKDVLISPVAPGQVITYTVVSPPGVTSERLGSLLATSGGIQIKLVMEYQDLAGSLYRSTVHLTRTNAGSIAFGPENRIE